MCWNCGQEAAGRFCAQCGVLQAPSSDYFDAFELPRSLNLNRKDLEDRYYRFSRQFHPDLFARRAEKERNYSLEASAVLNDAWRVLRDPVSRAQYVLKREGFDIGEQGTKDVPPELLEEVFELNMLLEEQPDASELEKVRLKFEGMRDETDAELKALFPVWDASHQRETLEAIRKVLNRRKYITNLIARTENV